MTSPGPGRRPDLSRSRAQYRGRASRYDFELLPFEPLRSEAIGLLDLREGDCVLDVGCGTGLSFAPLKERIGSAGRIVGIDPSPEMLAQAKERAGREGWSGIELLQAPAASAALHGRADAALFHFTHDVLRDAHSLDHVLAHLKPGACVVAAGLQWSAPWMVPANLFVWAAASYSVSSLEGLQRPWELLAARLSAFELFEKPWAGMYIARGRVPGASRHPGGSAHPH